MASDTIDWALVVELIRAKQINAKREKEYSRERCTNPDGTKTHGAQSDYALLWEGQETAYTQLLTILEK